MRSVLCMIPPVRDMAPTQTLVLAVVRPMVQWAAGVVDPSSAEVLIGSGTKRDLVGELANAGLGSSDDASLPLGEEVPREHGGGEGHGGQSKEDHDDTELVHFQLKTVKNGTLTPPFIPNPYQSGQWSMIAWALIGSHLKEKRDKNRWGLGKTENNTNYQFTRRM